MFYTIYQITNILNNHIYIGCHTTKKLNDNYRGSGTKLKRAYKEFGKENFRKDILFIFDTKEEMLNKERELVDEIFIAREDTYNVILGGDTYLNTDYVPVKDKDGNYLLIHILDHRYVNGELIPASCGLVTVKDVDGNTFKIETNDTRYLSGELVHNMTNCVSVRDISGNNFIVSRDHPKYTSGEYIAVNKGMTTVRDKNGKTFNVDMNDPRFLSGELVHINKGRRNSLETIAKKSGQNNSQFGKCWITKSETCENKKIHKDELDHFLTIGWKKGRKYYK